MGIINNLFKTVVSTSVYNAADSVSEKIINNMESNTNKSIDSFLSKNPNHQKYVLNHYKNTWRDTYTISTMSKKLYTAKGNLFSLKNNLIIYDNKTKKPIAKIKEQLFLIKNPLSLYSSKRIFKLSANNQNLGKAIVKTYALKKNYTLPFSNWRIEQNALETHYTIVENETVIMEAIIKSVKDRNIYYIDISNHDHNLQCLLILLMIESTKLSKRQRMKLVTHNKFF